MRRFLTLLFFVLVASLTQTSQARKFALLVGVDSYVSVQSLNCCVNDMNTLKEALMKIGFEENDIQILVTGAVDSKNQPTKRNIERNISRILTIAQPTDMVFLALSGHGAQEGKNVYFCPPDVELDDLPGTCVSINKVMDLLANQCQAKFKWMVVDACRNDPNQGPKGIGGKGLQVVPTPPAGIALFQSCAEGEESWEDRDSGNGFFTKNFAAALSGEADSNNDGNLTLMEVCTWTTTETQKQVRDWNNKSQRPSFSGTITDFTLAEDVNVRIALELAEEGRKAMDEENYELAIQKFIESLARNPRDRAVRRDLTMAQRLLPKKPRSTGENSGEHNPPTTGKPPRQSTVDDFSGNEFKVSLVQMPSEPYKPGDHLIYKVNGVDFVFCWCPPGEFMMGPSIAEKSLYRSFPGQHRVTLTKGFWMMETEVTQKQWKAIMGKNPSRSTLSEDLPVEAISWNDCQEFCNKFTKHVIPIKLPTEAQWEYACRAGSTTAYFWGNALNGDMANCNGQVPFGTKIHGTTMRQTAPVKRYSPNAWGLFDMHGNVSEWCEDYWASSYASWDVTDPLGPASGSGRVLRGGNFRSNSANCRSAARASNFQNYRDPTYGFRCIKEQ